MAQIVKKISAPYVLISANTSPTLFTVGAESTNNAEVIINGNLTVRGNSVVVESDVTTITDSTITVNKGHTPADTGFAGIEVDRGAGNFTPALLWDEAIDRWVLDNGTGPAVISTQTDIAYLARVEDDPAPKLGGNLDVNGRTIRSSDNIVLESGMYTQIDSAVQLKNISTIPPAEIAGYNLLYAGNVAGGGTGVFVTNSVAVRDQELVSKRRAIVYSLIF